MSSEAEPLNARQAEYLANFVKDIIVCITRASAPVETGCLELLALAFAQEGRIMTLTGKESPELTN